MLAAGMPYYYATTLDLEFDWGISDETLIKQSNTIDSWSGKVDDSSDYFKGEKAKFYVIGEGECDIIVTVKQFPELRAVCHVDTRPSGVDGVELEEVPQDVYNLQSVRVKANATKADIDALPAGIYIVGGKKIVKTN